MVELYLLGEQNAPHLLRDCLGGRVSSGPCLQPEGSMSCHLISGPRVWSHCPLLRLTPGESSGSCVRMGQEVSCCQLRAHGDGLCLLGICVGCCQSRDAVSGRQHGHTAYLRMQGGPAGLASFSGTWLPDGAWRLARSGCDSDFRKTKGQLCLGRWLRA